MPKNNRKMLLHCIRNYFEKLYTCLYYAILSGKKSIFKVKSGDDPIDQGSSNFVCDII